MGTFHGEFISNHSKSSLVTIAENSLICHVHGSYQMVDFYVFSSFQDTEIFNTYRDITDDKHKSQLLSVLKLRYFTPREVANLHGFPEEFCKLGSLSVWLHFA